MPAGLVGAAESDIVASEIVLEPENDVLTP